MVCKSVPTGPTFKRNILTNEPSGHVGIPSGQAAHLIGLLGGVAYPVQTLLYSRDSKGTAIQAGTSAIKAVVMVDSLILTLQPGSSR